MKAEASRILRWFFLFLIASLNLSAMAAADLTGVVKGPDGRPIRDASVFIYTAGPQQGLGIYCPSCYADCRKSTRSSASGEFKIEDLDPTLIFEILVVAKNFTPAFFKKVDPKKGPLDADLQPQSRSEIPAAQTILGRVVNSKKEPVVGAVVSVNGTTIGNTTYGRPPNSTDPLAVTDEQGDFMIRSAGPFDSMALRVEARACAKLAVNEVKPGTKRREITITEGAVLTGRVVKNGKPLAGVAVGVAQSDRIVGGGFTGDYSIATQEDGTFAFVNLPPNFEYDFYGVMKTLQAHGAIPDRKIRLQGDGSTLNLGDVPVLPGFRLAGQVKLADDQSLPEHTQLMIGREGAWDSLLFDLPSHGRFDFANIPAEQISLHLRVPGYRLSARNASASPMNPGELVGRLTADKTNLVVLFEPGETKRSNYRSLPPEEERPENLPLGGIEAVRKTLNGVTFTGQVLDAISAGPIPAFRITPGYQRTPTMKDWIEWGRSIEASNGIFALEVPLRNGTVVLKAEADGYLPARSDSLDAKNAKWGFRLAKGSGPKGVILLPDGKPAEYVTVICIAENEQASLDNKGQLQAHPEGGSEQRMNQRTGADGIFEFAPRLGPAEIIAASDEGFARTSAQAVVKFGKILLQPWAKVRGRLMKSGQPVAGEHLDLRFSRANNLGMGPILNLHGTVTDDSGRFALEFVPPIELNLSTRVPMEEVAGAWTVQPQKQFTAKPGADIDLGDIEKVAAPGKLGFGR